MQRDNSLLAKNRYIEEFSIKDAFPGDTINLIELHRLKKGEYLCQTGGNMEFFHIIVEGRCKVLSSSESGKEFLLDYLKPLSLSGDIEMFNDCETLHSVRASTPVAALAISRQVFFDEMMHIPAFLQMICKHLARKIYASSRRHSSNMLYPIKNRFCRILITAREEQNSLNICLKMGETAQTLGISSRHLRRVLSAFETEGLIVRQDRQIIILDENALIALSSYK